MSSRELISRIKRLVGTKVESYRRVLASEDDESELILVIEDPSSRHWPPWEGAVAHGGTHPAAYQLASHR